LEHCVMAATDWIVIGTVFGILGACLAVDWWVRNRD